MSLFLLLEFSACPSGAAIILLNNEGPDVLYPSPKFVRVNNHGMIRRDGHFTLEEEKLKAHTTLVQKSEIKRPLGRPRTRWKYNIKKNLGEIGWKIGTDFI